jgi:hypothetical protein
MAIGVEETQHAFGLLERLDQAIEQQPIKTPVAKLDAMLVMLDEGVHGTLLCGEIPGAYRHERFLLYGHLQTSPDLSRPAGLAEGSWVGAGGVRFHRECFPSRRHTVSRYRCVG